jgi:hypothetical protein
VFSILDRALTRIEAGLMEQRSRFAQSVAVDYRTINPRLLVREAWNTCLDARDQAVTAINSLPGWVKPLSEVETEELEKLLNIVKLSSGPLERNEEKLERDFQEILSKHKRASRYFAYIPGSAVAGGVGGSLIPVVGNILGAIGGAVAGAKAAQMEQNFEIKQDLMSDFGGRYERLMKRARSEATLLRAKSCAQKIVTGDALDGVDDSK